MAMAAPGDDLIDDVALYLRLHDSDVVNAVEHFERMRDRHSPPAPRRLPGPRYEFRRPGESRGILVAPVELDRAAAARNQYEEGSEPWRTLTGYMADMYGVGGTLAHDVYTDNESVWIDDGEEMEEVESVSEAMPLDNLVGAYETVRDLGEGDDAKEQFDQITATYRVGFVDADRDICLLYDPGTGTGYVFDTFEIDLREMDGDINEFIDSLGSDADPGGDVDIQDILSGED